MTNQSSSPDLSASLVRTGVPFAAGLIGTWALERFGVEVDTATVGALLTAGIGYLYYVVVRFLEVFANDKWGYILGFRKQPLYVDPPAVAVDADGRHELGSVSVNYVGVLLAVAAVVLLVVALIADAAVLVAVAAVALLVAVLLLLFTPRSRRPL